ncbi:MAG: AAA family ATPase [Desulfatitalea sp.]|nr:AAA family ATPase [Desulfatitalea sp.]NNJ99051.1 AAA family ATPase [Desulfatitalea sp.]
MKPIKRQSNGYAMTPFESVKAFYENNLPNATRKGHHLVAPCPFCAQHDRDKPTHLAVYLNPDSYFRGHFRCLNECVPAGFHVHFGRLMGIDGHRIPGFDPEAETYTLNLSYPSRHLGSELDKFSTLMGPDQQDYFTRFGVTARICKQMRIGFNGRYLVYPYFQENGHAYAARCVLPEKEENYFFHGNEAFFTGEAAVYNTPEIGCCHGGALFITEGELNALILKSLGYPAVAVPAADALAEISSERLACIEHLFLLINHSPEGYAAARSLALRMGFRARILSWPARMPRGECLAHLAADPQMEVKKEVLHMIATAKAFSPFASPKKEHDRFMALLEKEKGKTLPGLTTGFVQLDRHMEGLRGINILGGPPKAGKSCFFMQISTEVARRQVPVIYYDFENGRQKIYLRTLVRLAGLSEKQIRSKSLDAKSADALAQAQTQLATLLHYFRVVNDRQLTADTMRRHIDFIKHETGKDDLLIVVDSLHKLPFKDLTERRTGIDAWLRHLEAIRDEHRACFLVISELSRGKGGGYGEKPDLSSFKESGDIEYSADNALILMPDWDPMSPTLSEQRKNTLWMVASRETSPGRVGQYLLAYPFWRFTEVAT